ncbi:hypothetical protein [Cohnella sp. JJ-181]|uniref:hypothetical protein n=1 Tax=Cohnella rhizoplanae TaxID=2974897 RepID=UPI0022FFB19C|nr:hypothetical protein [Cohnella sp. JJ-181]CAI6069162.1 hypothetical protein COHCIP112018_02209 [Cohnella sp. JJ-181]
MSGEEGWLPALASWTEQALGDAAWRVYAGEWPASYERPAVLWRMTAAETRTGNAAFGETTRRYAGHVLGRDAAEQSDAAALLADELTQAVKLPLDAADRRYLLVRQAAADANVDPLATGQLSLTLSRKSSRPFATAPPMREISFRQIEE